MKLSFSLSGPSLELWPLLPALETSLRSFLSEKLHLISLVEEWGDGDRSFCRERGEEGRVNRELSSVAAGFFQRRFPHFISNKTATKQLKSFR